MGATFSDISLYTPIPYEAGTPEYREITSLENFISDLYVQHMNGYKPVGATRITVQPSYYGIWKKPEKMGSIVSVAPYYNYDEFAALEKREKYKYVLDLIQQATIISSEEFNWDKSVFERAYENIIETDFKFQINCPPKQARDKKKSGYLSIEKTESVTSMYVNVIKEDQTIKQLLFEKKNSWRYDCVYILSKYSKWFDSDKFGIAYRKNRIIISYSLEQNKIAFIEKGNEVESINFRNHFLFQQ
jgi:hypothetical protein